MAAPRFSPARPSALIARPRRRAAAAAAALKRMGFAPFVLPLSRIAPLPFSLSLPAAREPQSGAAAPFSAALATSANAFAAPLPAALKTLPLYCVGAKTAAAAKACGFSAPQAAADTAALIQMLAAVIKAEKAGGGRFCPLYLAGRPRRAALEDFLRQAAVPFQTAELYAAVPLPLAAAQTAALPRPLDCILLYSGQNAAGLGALRAHIGGKTRILCLSPRIAAAVPQQWRRQTESAAAPNQKALLALLAPAAKG